MAANNSNTEGPPREVLERYKKEMANYKQPTKIPNEDFTRLKTEMFALRALAEKRKAEKPDEPISEAERSEWREMFSDMAMRRPSLFHIAANPDKDMKIALGMIDIMQFQRDSKNYDIEDATHKLVNFMCDQTGFAQGKRWLAQSEKERKEARRRTKYRNNSST